MFEDRKIASAIRDVRRAAIPSRVTFNCRYEGCWSEASWERATLAFYASFSRLLPPAPTGVRLFSEKFFNYLTSNSFPRSVQSLLAHTNAREEENIASLLRRLTSSFAIHTLLPADASAVSGCALGSRRCVHSAREQRLSSKRICILEARAVCSVSR